MQVLQKTVAGATELTHASVTNQHMITSLGRQLEAKREVETTAVARGAEAAVTTGVTTSLASHLLHHLYP